jgi:hypothetical protein
MSLSKSVPKSFVYDMDNYTRTIIFSFLSTETLSVLQGVSPEFRNYSSRNIRRYFTVGRVVWTHDPFTWEKAIVIKWVGDFCVLHLVGTTAIVAFWSHQLGRYCSNEKDHSDLHYQQPRLDDHATHRVVVYRVPPTSDIPVGTLVNEPIIVCPKCVDGPSITLDWYAIIGGNPVGEDTTVIQGNAGAAAASIVPVLRLIQYHTQIWTDGCLNSTPHLRYHPHSVLVRVVGTPAQEASRRQMLSRALCRILLACSMAVMCERSVQA